MRSHPVLFACLALACSVAACGSDASDASYGISYTCPKSGGASCPAGASCPKVPLGSGGCETLPGLHGHAPIGVEDGRPEGCEVGLPYGNPSYGDTQQTCTCSTLQPGTKPRWVCPI